MLAATNQQILNGVNSSGENEKCEKCKSLLKE